jgi:hypothetical protein
MTICFVTPIAAAVPFGGFDLGPEKNKKNLNFYFDDFFLQPVN